MEVLFFEHGDAFYAWLEKNHKTLTEQWIGYYKKKSGIPSMTWSESVDQALCFGWIDGIRKSIDEQRYKIRFTPRRATSSWSDVNIKKMAELIKSGRMRSPGFAAYEKWTQSKSQKYSYEQRTVNLPPIYEDQLRSRPVAWEFWQLLAPSYKKASVHWVISAKKEETRLRRMDILIQSCEEGKKIPLLRRKGE